MAPPIEPVRADFAGRVHGPSVPGGRGGGRAGRAPAGHALVSVSELLEPDARPGRERPERAKWGKVIIGGTRFPCGKCLGEWHEIQASNI